MSDEMCDAIGEHRCEHCDEPCNCTEASWGCCEDCGYIDGCAHQCDHTKCAAYCVKSPLFQLQKAMPPEKQSRLHTRHVPTGSDWIDALFEVSGDGTRYKRFSTTLEILESRTVRVEFTTYQIEKVRYANGGKEFTTLRVSGPSHAGWKMIRNDEDVARGIHVIGATLFD